MLQGAVTDNGRRLTRSSSGDIGKHPGGLELHLWIGQGQAVDEIGHDAAGHNLVQMRVDILVCQQFAKLNHRISLCAGAGLQAVKERCELLGRLCTVSTR